MDQWILVQGSDEGETSSGWSRDRANGLNGRKIVDTDTDVYERRQSFQLLTSRPIDADPRTTCTFLTIRSYKWQLKYGSRSSKLCNSE
jgi:hypothetical protein